MEILPDLASLVGGSYTVTRTNHKTKAMAMAMAMAMEEVCMVS